MALSTTTVSISDVRDVMGADTNDLRALCLHPNLNKHSASRPGYWRQKAESNGKKVLVYAAPDYTQQDPRRPGMRLMNNLGDFRGYEHWAGAPDLVLDIEWSGGRTIWICGSLQSISLFNQKFMFKSGLCFSEKVFNFQPSENFLPDWGRYALIARTRLGNGNYTHQVLSSKPISQTTLNALMGRVGSFDTLNLHGKLDVDLYFGLCTSDGQNVIGVADMVPYKLIPTPLYAWNPDYPEDESFWQAYSAMNMNYRQLLPFFKTLVTEVPDDFFDPQNQQSVDVEVVDVVYDETTIGRDGYTNKANLLLKVYVPMLQTHKYIAFLPSPATGSATWYEGGIEDQSHAHQVNNTSFVFTLHNALTGVTEIHELQNVNGVVGFSQILPTSGNISFANTGGTYIYDAEKIELMHYNNYQLIHNVDYQE